MLSLMDLPPVQAWKIEEIRPRLLRTGLYVCSVNGINGNKQTEKWKANIVRGYFILLCEPTLLMALRLIQSFKKHISLLLMDSRSAGMAETNQITNVVLAL